MPKKENGKTESGWKSSYGLILAVIAIGGMVGYLLVIGGGDKVIEQSYGTSAKAENAPAEPKEAGLVETAPILPADTFSGRIADAYGFAAKIPEVIDSLYCYCQCKENPRFRHKTLLTCYTDSHASNCEICLHEAEMAWEMTGQGKSKKEIRAAVDEYYAKK